jgi:putative phage-type endonuclease
MELRLRKLGLLPDKCSSDAMTRGQTMEPIARDHFHKIYNNLIFTPAVVESSEFLFLGASLDGITDDGKAILEIKCGVKSHEMAKNGEIPEYYLCQIQHQLICTRAEKCFYFSYQSEQDFVMIEVLPEKDFEEHYVPLAEMFWMDLIFKKPEIFIEKEKS